MPTKGFSIQAIDRAFNKAYLAVHPIAERLFEAAREFAVVEPDKFLGANGDLSGDEVQSLKRDFLEFRQQWVHLSEEDRTNRALALAVRLLKMWSDLNRLPPC